MSLLRKLERQRPFSGEEAWLLFKLAAFGEAIGWTLLITGILTKQFLMHGNNAPVLMAGQLHGTLFIIYIVAVIVLYPSLRWSRRRTIIAGLASVPPYGSLVFEQWAAHERAGRNWEMRRAILTYAVLTSG
jgi:integral membrane protein